MYDGLILLSVRAGSLHYSSKSRCFCCGGMGAVAHKSSRVSVWRDIHNLGPMLLSRDPSMHACPIHLPGHSRAFDPSAERVMISVSWMDMDAFDPGFHRHLAETCHQELLWGGRKKLLISSSRQREVRVYTDCLEEDGGRLWGTRGFLFW
mmetsp:Transcript_3624/g.8942  ORF Transcript_3624/g.8942 Transcript_3624/m.8942 type:complete len:150 (+) Transcript_3624:328-777(+)